MALLYIFFIYFFNYFTIRIGILNFKTNKRIIVTVFQKIIGIDIFFIKGTIIYRFLYIINILLFITEIVLFMLNLVDCYRKMSIVSSILYLVILTVNVISNIFN